MGAASTLTQPAFLPVTMYGQLYQYQSPLRLLQVFEVPWHFGRPMGGFHIFETMSIRRDIIQTFLDVSEMSQALELYTTAYPDGEILTPILDSRAHLIHRLLSLPETMQDAVIPDMNNELSSADQNQTAFMLYTCSRLVAQLYGLHVIFPIPRVVFVKSRLIPEIRETVSQLLEVDSSPTTLELLLWSCMISAVAAGNDHLEMEAWFVDRLRQLSLDLKIDTYEGAKNILRIFGCASTACDRYAIEVWNRSARLDK